MIELTTPIVRTRRVPQTSYLEVEDNFNGVWITDIRIQGTPTGSISATITTMPFDSETGLLSQNKKDLRRLVIPDIYEVAAEDPAEVGAGVQGLINAIGFLVAKHGLNDPEGPRLVDLGAPEPAPEPEP